MFSDFSFGGGDHVPYASFLRGIACGMVTSVWLILCLHYTVLNKLSHAARQLSTARLRRNNVLHDRRDRHGGDLHSARPHTRVWMAPLSCYACAVWFNARRVVRPNPAHSLQPALLTRHRHSPHLSAAATLAGSTATLPVAAWTARGKYVNLGLAAASAATSVPFIAAAGARSTLPIDGDGK